MELSKENRSNGESRSEGPFSLLDKEIVGLKATLLNQIGKMRSAREEADAWANSEIQQWGRLKHGLESKIAMLESQLREKEESLREKESANKKLEESLTTRLQELEHRLGEKEALLEAREEEISALRLEGEKKARALEVQIQEKEKSLSARESAIKEIEHGLNTKFQNFKLQLAEKESLISLLERRNMEITDLRSEAEKKANALEAQMQKIEESLQVKESSIQKIEESFSKKMQDMETRLKGKETLLDARKEEIDNLRSRIDTLITLPQQNPPAIPQGIPQVIPQDPIILREEDSVTSRKSEGDREEAEKLEGWMAVDVSKPESKLNEKAKVFSGKEMEVDEASQSFEKSGRDLEESVKTEPSEEQKRSRLLSYVHIGKVEGNGYK